MASFFIQMNSRLPKLFNEPKIAKFEVHTRESYGIESSKKKLEKLKRETVRPAP